MADVASGPILTAEGAAFFSAALATGIGALAAAWSQGTVGAAAMGVAAERPEFEKNVLIYIVLPEILAIFGFLIGVLLWMKAGAA